MTSNDVFDIIEAINNEMTHDGELVKFGEKLRKDNIGRLLKNDRFRAKLDSGGKEAIWQQLDELVFAADLVKKSYFVCPSHTSDIFHEPSIDANEETMGYCTICQAQSRNDYGHYGDGDSGQHRERTVWISKTGKRTR